MRWFIFSLLLLPNILAADQSEREEILEMFSSHYLCGMSMIPFNSEYYEARHSDYINKVRQNRLIMKFEIDAEFYSQDNLSALATLFAAHIEEQYKEDLFKIRSMPEDELNYMILKLQGLESKNAPMLQQFMDDPKFHAAFIKKCATSYGFID